MQMQMQMMMSNKEKNQEEEEGGNGLIIKPTLLRLGSNNSTITDSSSVDDHDNEDDQEEEMGEHVMFTDSCPKCGSKKRRCVTPAFKPRKKPIFINNTKDDQDQFFHENSRTRSIPLMDSDPFLFHQQIPPPNSSSPPPYCLINPPPTSTPPPPPPPPQPSVYLSSSPIDNYSVKLTPPRFDPCNCFIRSHTIKKLDSEGRDQTTIFTNSKTLGGNSPTFHNHEVNLDSKAAGDRRTESNKRLIRIKEGLKVVNTLLEDIIEEDRQQVDEIKKEKETHEYYYETLPEENVISLERDDEDTLRVRFICYCGNRYQIFLDAAII